MCVRIVFPTCVCMVFPACVCMVYVYVYVCVCEGVCILCGDGKHWLRACHLFDPAVHVPNQRLNAGKSKPTTTYVVPRRSKVQWCLRCATEAHCTSECVSSNPPVSFPPDQGEDKRKDIICLWCGVKGHELKECWKRTPAVTEGER